MVPDGLTLTVLVLAAYRLTRLAGWDDFPLAARTRAWVIGERRVPDLAGKDLAFMVPGVDVAPLPSASPFTEPELEDVGRSLFNRAAVSADEFRSALQPGPVYSRPTLAHMVFCPFCIGWWISLATWVAWLCWHPVEYGLMPFAISGAVGLIAKNLDP